MAGAQSSLFQSNSSRPPPPSAAQMRFAASYQDWVNEALSG